MRAVARPLFACIAHCAVQPGRTSWLLAAAAFALGSAAFPDPVSAALYKWTDASGRVVYSDQPPTGDVKVETLQGPPPPANPNAVKEMAAKELEMKKRQADAAEKEKKSDSQRAEVAKKSEQCARMQAQIRQLAAEQISLIRLNEKGEQVYVAQKCSVCHSIAGKGGKQSPLDGVGTKLSADEIRQWIVEPIEMAKKTSSTKKPPMPKKYDKLPPAELDALVAYMQSLKK